MSHRIEDHKLAGHPDEGVRVWHAYLYGDSIAAISRDEDLSARRIRQLLEASPPDLIASDLRYRTGLRSLWINQSGEDDLRQEADGKSYPFIVLLHPHRITQAALRKGVRAARDQIRASGRPKFDFGYVSEAAEMWSLLGMVHRRGYPAWEVTADGKARRYDGRFEEIVPPPREPDEPSVLAKP